MLCVGVNLRRLNELGFKTTLWRETGPRELLGNLIYNLSSIRFSQFCR